GDRRQHRGGADRVPKPRPQTPMTFALIPAGGKSTRMGRPKLALPLGGRTVLDAVVTALARAGVEHILVVATPQVPELVPLAKAAGADVYALPAETPD